MEAVLRDYAWRDELDDVEHGLEDAGSKLRDGLETLVPAVQEAGDALRSALPDMTRVEDSVVYAAEVAGGVVLKLLIGGLVGVAVMLATAVALGALVPLAMSLFGVVVAGTGTLHSSRGLAACLQRLSVHLVRPQALLIGAVVGVVVTAVVMIVKA